MLLLHSAAPETEGWEIFVNLDSVAVVVDINLRNDLDFREGASRKDVWGSKITFANGKEIVVQENADSLFGEVLDEERKYYHLYEEAIQEFREVLLDIKCALNGICYGVNCDA